MTRSSERLPGLAWLFARILRRAARTPGWVTLWTAIAEHRRLLRTTLLAVFVWAGLKVLGPQLLAGVLEEGASSRTLVALFVVVGLVTAVLTSVRRRLVHLLSRRVERSLLVSVHDHGTALVRGGANPSDVVAYSGDPGRTQLFVQLVPIVAANLLQLLAAAAFMVWVSPVLAAAATVPLVLGWRLYVRQARALEVPSARARDAQGRMLGLFDEHVTNDNVIRGFGLRDRHAGAFLDAGAITEERNLAVSRTKSFYGPATDMVVTSTAIFVVLVGGNLALAGRVSLADLLLFQLYASMLLWPLRNLGALIASSVSACEAAGRVALLGSRVQGRPEPTTMPAPGWHSILADSPELPGELEGAYAVSGRSPGVFAGSIRENVAMGSVHEIDDRDVEEYCRAVGLDGEIRLRTGGYDSDPGEGGKLLSGGQRQRLALARALAADPCVLVLESALDAVDATTAAEVLEEVRRRRGSRSTFLLTSDSEQVRDTDAVLDRRDRRASGHSVSAAGRPVPPDHCPAPETIRRTGPSAEPAVGPAVGPAVEEVITEMREPLDDAPHLPSTWRDVLRGLPPGRALAAAFGVLAAGAFTSLIAVLQGRAVDQGVVTGDRAMLLFYVAGQFAAAFGAFAVSLFHARSLGFLGERLIRKLRRSVLLVLGRRDVSFYDRDGTGTILSRITSDAEAVKGAVCGSSLPLLSYTALAAGALGMAAVTYPQYLPVVVPCVLLLVLAGMSFLRTSAKVYPEVQQATAEVLAALRENLSCARALLHGDPRGTRVNLFKGKVDRYVETQVRVVDVTNLFASCVEGLGVVATGLVAYLWLESATGPGALFVLFGLFASVFEPLQNAIQSYGSVRPGRVALGRLHEGLGAEPREAAAQPLRVALPAGTATGAAGVPANASASGAAPLVYQAIGAGFFFGSLPVLRGVDLDVVEGERLAVVGRSGCGKSTLLALLAGVRRPSSGDVLYRGESTIPLGREVLWVPQEVQTFGGTVRENLALMLGGVGTDDLVDRLWASALGEVLVPLLEVPAAALSIPEARLLVYAGAALRRPDVLLLDEPTSGMGDVEREVLIRSLRALGRGSTVVLVTHSPSLAAACDRVVSLREGVVEKLPH